MEGCRTDNGHVTVTGHSDAVTLTYLGRGATAHTQVIEWS